MGRLDGENLSRPPVRTGRLCSLCTVSDGLHIPAYSDLLWPTLRAVREIGNSGTNEEIVERVLADEGFTEEQLAVPANNGRSGLIEYRLAWARSHLKGMALLEEQPARCMEHDRTGTDVGSVGSGAVRDFRGAMSGRGEKGLLITTGTYTSEAKRESTRDGAPPVDLIDGDQLCDLLKQYELGVRCSVRQIEDVAIDPEFFAEL